jgi:hypothetical protein
MQPRQPNLRQDIRQDILAAFKRAKYASIFT